MRRFLIENVVGGVVLGVYCGETELDAYREMMGKAGCEAGDAIPDDISVRPVEDVVREFARSSAALDYRVCSAHEDLEMTEDWAGEHTDALAERLGMEVSELGELIDIAEREYRLAARKLMRAA